MAYVKISELETMQELSNTDLLPIVDVSETETKKITKQNLLTDINAEEVQIGQLTEATQINDEDYLIITQNGTNKKISKANAKFASGDEISIGTTQPSEDEVLWINPTQSTNQAKYKYNNTWNELSIKALDSMPIGTIVDFDGETSDIPTGWEEVGNDYSTTEINTGKTWIDGKPIYRKVCRGIVPAGLGVSVYTDTNIDSAIDYYGLYYHSGTPYVKKINFYFSPNDYMTLNFNSNSKTYVLDNTSMYNNVGTVDLIIEYTKTTD